MDLLNRLPTGVLPTLACSLAVAVAMSAFMAVGGRYAPWGSVEDPVVSKQKFVQRVAGVKDQLPGAVALFREDGSPVLLVNANSVEEFERAKFNWPGVELVVGLSDPGAISTIYEAHRTALQRLPAVTFMARSSDLDSNGLKAVDTLAQLISAYPYMTEVVSLKDDVIWESLARERGDALLSALKARGVDLSKVDYSYRSVTGSLEKRIHLEATLK